MLVNMIGKRMIFFYNRLEYTTISVPDQEYTYLCGDLNEHLGICARILSVKWTDFAFHWLRHFQTLQPFQTLSLKKLRWWLQNVSEWRKFHSDWFHCNTIVEKKMLRKFEGYQGRRRWNLQIPIFLHKWNLVRKNCGN